MKYAPPGSPAALEFQRVMQKLRRDLAEQFGPPAPPTRKALNALLHDPNSDEQWDHDTYREEESLGQGRWLKNL